jgi:hypothetical protein
MRLDGLAQGLSHIAEQMPAIGHLNGLRSSIPAAVGVGSRTIPRNDHHARMGLEPGGDRARLAIRQQIDDLVVREIDQDGAVAVAFAVRSVVQPQNRRRRAGWCRCAQDQPQKRVRADRDGQAAGQACARLSTGCESNGPLDLGQPRGAAGGSDSNADQGFGKGAAATKGI